MSRRIVPSDEVLYGMKTGNDYFPSFLIPHSLPYLSHTVYLCVLYLVRA